MKSDRKLYEEPGLVEIYDAAFQGPGKPQGDFAFWRDLARESKGPLLELACGTGRLAIPLAREGFQVTGLDISPPMLAAARRKLAQEPTAVRAHLELIEGDMSNFSLNKKFRLIFIGYRSFQHLLTRASQRQCLACCAAHLSPGGRLGINVFYPKLSLISQAGEVPFDFGESFMPDGAKLHQTAAASYDTANQLLSARMRFEITDIRGNVTTREYPLVSHYFFRYEMEWMLEACGFEVEALYGNHDKSPLQANSPEMIFVAKKRQFGCS